MLKIKFAWNPINIGLVIDFPDLYIAIGIVFITIRYQYIRRGE